MDEHNHGPLNEILAYRQLDQLLEHWANDIVLPLAAADHFPLDDSVCILSDADLGYDWWRQLIDRSRPQLTTLPITYWHARQVAGNN